MHDYENFINGKWRRSESGNTFENINPADTTDRIGHFQDSTEKDLQNAVSAAKAAYKRWNQIPVTSREVYLYKAADILERRLEETARSMTREMGKPLAESRGEVNRGVQILRYYAGEARRLCGETYPSDSSTTMLLTLREPLGIVGAITPWNFPLAIPLWKTAPAVVFGNTVVLKLPQDAPLTGILLGEVFEECGLPAGTVNIISGSGPELGKALVDHEGIDAVTFTGSNKVGRQIYRRCGELNKKVQLEMGGQNPVIVMPDANLDHAVNITIAGAFFSAGQKCTSTRRVIVHHSIIKAFTEKLIEASSRLIIGEGTDENVKIGPIINQGQLDKIMAGIQSAKNEGATLVYGGEGLKEKEFAKGFFVKPTIFSDVKPGMTIAEEEVFGPLLGIMEFNELDDALNIANSVSYGLSASIVTRDVTAVFKFVKEIKAGIVHVNSQTAGAECHVPFGGMKESSSGTREQGKASLEFFTQLKTVYMDPPAF